MEKREGERVHATVPKTRKVGKVSRMAKFNYEPSPDTVLWASNVRMSDKVRS